MALIGLATAAAQAKEVELDKPSFPKRTASAPPLKRDISGLMMNSPIRSSSAQQKPGVDWRLFLTVEERQMIRSKISAGYENKAKTYEELLQICSAIEEELVFISAPSRLDYFKTGLQFEKRVSEKQRQLKGSDASASSLDSQPPAAPTGPSSEEQLVEKDTNADGRPTKKVRLSE